MTPEQWANSRILWLMMVVDREHYKINERYRNSVNTHVQQLVSYLAASGAHPNQLMDQKDVQIWQQRFDEQHENRLDDLQAQLEQLHDSLEFPGSGSMPPAPG